MRVGVVVPVRDEPALLATLLSTLGPFREADDPIVVVDDGSEDADAIAVRAAEAGTIRQERAGRGIAIARGVESLRSRADAILILHADMHVPAAARAGIVAALSGHTHVPGGALGHRIDDPRGIFRWVERGNRFRAERLHLPYGDQGQFFRLEALDGCGGFPAQPRLEDLELSLRLRRRGPLVYLDLPVTIPSRHWRGGVVLTTLRNWGIAARYRLFHGRG